MPNLIADVFLQPSKSIIVHTTPGRDVKFYGGHARVYDHRDMPHMLAREDARIIPTVWGMSWVGDWLSHTQKINATVEWPEGYAISHASQDEFVIDRPDGGVVAAQPVASVEVLPDSTPTFPNGKSLIDVLMKPEKSVRKSRPKKKAD